MALPLSTARTLATASATDAWAAIFDHALQICTRPLTAASAPGEVTKRDRETSALDLFLATCGWDLWREFEQCATRTAEVLATWWSKRSPGRAVLILDGLSLREVPWLLQGAKEHGFNTHEVRATASELPGETTPFAQALGFSTRSALDNNSAPASHRLPKARTESVGLPL